MFKQLKKKVIMAVVVLIGGGGFTAWQFMGGENFTVSKGKYVATQQALMQKQAEGVNGDFEEVSSHAEELVKSSEYKKWLEASKELSDADATKEDKKVQDTIMAYNKIQKEYFEELVEANDSESFNQVVDRVGDKLSQAEAKYFEIIGVEAE